MTNDDIPGCHDCEDPLNVSLRRENEVLQINNSIAVFRCPHCGCLILDDVLGWKGSGIVMRATKERILRYARERGVAEAELSQVQDRLAQLGQTEPDHHG